MMKCKILFDKTCPTLGLKECDGCDLYKIWNKYERDSRFIELCNQMVLDKADSGEIVKRVTEMLKEG